MRGAVLDVDPRSWTWWTYGLYGFALWAAGAFVWFWFRFHALERRAVEGGTEDVARFNKALSGFPNAVYAKMMGKRRLQAESSPDAGSR